MLSVVSVSFVYTVIISNPNINIKRLIINFYVKLKKIMYKYGYEN